MEHKHIKSENGEVHYWIKKNENDVAKCLVFTHGLTANHAMFERQIEYFSVKNSVITWDVPLHGCSRPYRDFSYRQTAIELNRILEKEKIFRVVLVGMSMGGYPSQMFASMFPEKVEGFVALDTTPFGMKYYSKSDLWWLRQVEPMAKWVSDRMLRKSMAKSVSNTKYSYDKMLEMLSPLSKKEILEQMGLAYGQFAAENKNVELLCPVLILLGDRDRTGKVRQYCEEWSKETGYPLHIIPHAAHFSNGDNPGQVNKEIEIFIRGLCARSRGSLEGLP